MVLMIPFLRTRSAGAGDGFGVAEGRCALRGAIAATQHAAMARKAVRNCRCILRLDSGEGRRDQKQALESDIAVGRLVPFRERVRAAAFSSAADGYGGNPARKRNVGVGGAAFEARAISEKAIHVANGGEERRIVRKLSGRARAERTEVGLER